MAIKEETLIHVYVYVAVIWNSVALSCHCECQVERCCRLTDLSYIFFAVFLSQVRTSLVKPKANHKVLYCYTMSSKSVIAISYYRIITHIYLSIRYRLVSLSAVSQRCESDEFECANGECTGIYHWARCDCDNDCEDGSDEANCSNVTTTCSDGSCALKCNCWQECDDGSDEADCEDINFITCDFGQCARKCDCYQGCSDGSDEANCPNSTCHRCADTGRVYPAFQRCDCIQNCADGSDEAGCPDNDCLTCAYRGNMYPSYLRCDCDEYCDDGSDESNCDGDPLNKRFVCGDGTCIDLDDRCDGVGDCDDDSDEAGCDGRNL